MAEYQKYYARHESDDGSYGLKSYWTSSQTVEFEDGQTLEEYKATLKEEIDAKGDELGYSLDEGEIYLYGNGQKISTSEMRLRVQPTIALDDISNLSIRLSKGRVRFTWQDPSDVVFSELTLVEWAGTRVVRKIGSAPDDPTDGTVLINSTTRDAYISDPYFDTTARDGVYYYYRFFPYDTDGNFYGRTCGVIFKPVTLEPVDVPYVENTYTYTGETITPEFVNYDKNKMTRSGANSAKNAGTYTVTFTLKEGYKWSDDTTAPRDVTWSIGKANGYIILSKTQVEVDDIERLSNVSVTGASGSITVTSSNAGVVTASYSNDVISLGYVSNGSAIVTVDVAESNNYLSTSTTISVMCVNIPIYGIKFGRSGTSPSTYLSTTSSERLDSAIEAYARSEQRNRAGGSSFDEFYPWADIEIVEDPLVGQLVKIPKYYYKCYNDTDGIYIKISRKQLNGYSVSPGHANRGDGKGERDYIYVGRYLSNNSNDYKSISGSQIKGTAETISSFRTNIHNLRNDVWLIDNATWWTYILLYLVEYGLHNYREADTTVVATFLGFRSGEGSNVGGQICGVSNATLNGTTDNMTFHTGCLNGKTYKASSKLEDYGYSSDGCQYRYIESFGSIPCFIDGVYNIIDSNSIMNIYNVLNPADSISGQDGICVVSNMMRLTYAGVQDYTVADDGYSLYPTVGGSISKDSKYGRFSGPSCDQFTINSSAGKKVLVNKSDWWQLMGTSRAFVPETTTCQASRLMVLP